MDIIFILLLFLLLFTNLPIKRMGGALKGLVLVAVLWFVARALNFHMAEAVLGNVTQYGFLLLIILFPKEFRRLLENLGRRRIFGGNTNNLISKESREELAKAVINMANRKDGGIILIAREDSLDDWIVEGEELGDVFINQNTIEMLFHPDSKVSGGAMIIRDDMILSANVRLPLTSSKALESKGAGRRHFAGLGAVTNSDAVAIVVSGDTGTISMFGKFDKKLSIDFGMKTLRGDMTGGMDETQFLNRLEDYLKGKDGNKVSGQTAQKRKVDVERRKKSNESIRKRKQVRKK